MSELEETNITIPLISAFGIHILFFFLANYSVRNFKSASFQDPNKFTKPLKLKRITRKQLQRYRTIGKKNGAKNVFAIPVKGDPKSKRKVISQGTGKFKDLASRQVIKRVKRTDLQDALSFKSLMPVGKVKVKKSRHYNKKIKFAKDSKLKLPSVSVQMQRSVERQRNIKDDLMTQLGPGTVNAKLANKSDFQIHFETPEGIDEDELNSAEKKYYSFQKRTFESYFHSFLKSYNTRLRSHPQLKAPLQRERHALTGRVTFDEQGNIVSIKILKWSKSDEVQELFEETLKSIRSLPNPPKSLLFKESKEFNIYYQLQIN
jgi:hypothetical protein